MLALNPDMYKLLIRPLLFRMPPEAAQSAVEKLLKQTLLWRTLAPTLRVRNPLLEVNVAGMSLDNPVGLAAGYDKNCDVLPSLGALGFGYVVGGTITESPRPGNPRPRVLRRVKEEALVNALGFPSKGLEFAAMRMEQTRDSMGGVPAIVSVSGVTMDEILSCHRRLEPLANAIEVNISSPNTAGLRVFQEPDTLSDLLDRLNDGRRKPLFVKMPPYASNTDDSERVLGLARVCVERGVDGLTVSNTWPVEDTQLAMGRGGLSGRPVFPETLRMVSEVRAEVGVSMAINACGGISSGDDAWMAIQAGADTVQILTSLIYRGPGIVKRINTELLGIMRRRAVRALDG